MKTIYKYPLEITDRQVVEMPRDAKILTVQTQRGVPCLWALVEPNNAAEARRIRIYGTGHPADDAGSYIETFQFGPLVFHVFEDRDE